MRQKNKWGKRGREDNFFAAVFYQNIMQIVWLSDVRCVYKHTSMKLVTIPRASSVYIICTTQNKTEAIEVRARACGAKNKRQKFQTVNNWVVYCYWVPDVFAAHSIKRETRTANTSIQLEPFDRNVYTVSVENERHYNNLVFFLLFIQFAVLKWLKRIYSRFFFHFECFTIFPYYVHRFPFPFDSIGWKGELNFKTTKLNSGAESKSNSSKDIFRSRIIVNKKSLLKMKIWSAVAIFMLIAFNMLANTFAVPVSQPHTVSSDFIGKYF